MAKPRRLIIVTGMSGAGKTIVLNALEDLDYYCVDRLPVAMLPDFLNYIGDSENPLYHRTAVGIDARNSALALANFPSILQSLNINNIPVELVFIDANNQVLIRRFSETRRKHPLSSEGVALAEAIRLERQLLGSLAEYADLRIDTSHTSSRQLWDYVRERIAKRPIAILSLQFVSFGFKNGLPLDTDFVFDVRCLPNPYWDPDLRPYSGRNEKVIEFLERAPQVQEMVQQIIAFLATWIPRFEAENRSYLTVAIGCTGGYHRSVYIVDQLAAYFGNENKNVLVNHRDM